jgi:hypothetical protein
MQWVEFGRNWRDPAPAAGIVVKLWKGRACQWLLFFFYYEESCEFVIERRDSRSKNTIALCKPSS